MVHKHQGNRSQNHHALPDQYVDRIQTITQGTSAMQTTQVTPVMQTTPGTPAMQTLHKL